MSHIPNRRFTRLAGVVLVAVASLASGSTARAQISFVDVTQALGVEYQHGFISTEHTTAMRISGGVAAGDYDRDGFTDLFVVRGDIGPNLLYRNDAGASFTEVGGAAGLDGGPNPGSGPLFADLDGDGWLDLVVGGIEGAPPAVYRNEGDGTFEDVSSTAGLNHGLDQVSVAAADFDRDGDLDLATAHRLVVTVVKLWENDGNLHFTDVSVSAGVSGISTQAFTPNFADLNEDGWVDLVVSADFGTSIVLMNDGDGTFTETTDPLVITDQNGMGASVGDYDNDGDIDWFVSSIWDPNGIAEGSWGITGNRLYQNDGNGNFTDVTTAAGVREGYWGWGSCFADFDNDGNLDIFHVNGFTIPAAFEYFDDPARLFMSNGDGTFTERASEVGVADTGQGRGVACFDFDRDGDTDIFIANNGQNSKLYRNVGGDAGNFMDIRLEGFPPNTAAVGARIYVTAGGVTQMRELRSGSNYVSGDPILAHFGLGGETQADVRIVWPNGALTVLDDIAENQPAAGFPAFHTFNQSLTIPAASRLALAAGALILLTAAGLLLRRD